MEKHPKFIRDFSKNHSDVADFEVGLTPRQEVAKQIYEKRSEAFDREKTLVERRKELEELANKVAYISENMPRMIKNYLKLRKLKAELVTKTAEHQDFAMADAEMQVDGTPEEFMVAEEVLNGYYKKIEQDWIESDYSREDIEKNFTEENLTSLSMEDYILLLQRFPGTMVNHVVGQGVKDHDSGGMAIYTGFLDTEEGSPRSGFTDIIKDKKIETYLSLAVTDEIKRKVVFDEFFEGVVDRDEALDRLDKILGNRIRPGAKGFSYNDKSALHFAAGEVLDYMYGCETGNEVVLAFPNQLIVTEYHPNTIINNGQSDSDVLVWTKENSGIPIDAGIVFLPENVQVSPESGSKYELDAEGNTQIIQGNIEAIRNLVGNDTILNEILENEGRGDNPELKGKLMKTYGLSEELSGMLISGDVYSLYNLRFKGKPESYTLEEVKEKSTLDIKHLLAKNQLLFKKPEHAIKAKDYWDQYFDAHPEQRPKHVVYYEGEPTLALKEWQIANRIRKSESIGKVDFSDRVVSSDSEEARGGSEEFKQLMLSMIDERFPEQKALAS